MGFGQLRIQLDRFAAGHLGFLPVVVARVPPKINERAAIRDAGISQRILRVNHDGASEKLPRKIKTLSTELMKKLASFQVVVVGLNIGCRSLFDSALFLLSEYQFQRLRNALRDLVLNGEYVFHLAVVTFRPHGARGGCFHQPGGDAQAISRAT